MMPVLHTLCSHSLLQSHNLLANAKLNGLCCVLHCLVFCVRTRDAQMQGSVARSISIAVTANAADSSSFSKVAREAVLMVSSVVQFHRRMLLSQQLSRTRTGNQRPQLKLSHPRTPVHGPNWLRPPASVRRQSSSWLSG